MLPWKLQKCQILPVNQNLSSIYFPLAKFQLVSCNSSRAIIWQMTYTQKLPKLCSATLNAIQSTLSKTDTFGIGSKCASYIHVEPNKGSKERQGPTLGVHFTEVSIKRESAVDGKKIPTNVAIESERIQHLFKDYKKNLSTVL